MNIHEDCRFYRGDRPCLPHKENGFKCESCSMYSMTQERILIIKLAADGDVLRTTSILKPIKKLYPYANITWLTEPSAAPLLKNNPDIDRIFSPPEQFISHLIVEKFDWVVNTDADPRSCAFSNIVSSSKKSGFALNDKGVVVPLSDDAREWWLMGLWDDIKKHNRKSYNQIIQKMLNLEDYNSSPQIYLTNDEIAEAKEYLITKGCTIDDKTITLGINTGSGKRWKRKALSAANMVSLIYKIRSNFPAMQIVLLGGQSEIETHKLLTNEFGKQVIDAGNSNSVRKFSSIISCLDLMLTGDTLALHIGVALKKYVIAFFGPTSPWEIDLGGKGAKIIAPMECVSCYLNDCAVVNPCNEKDYANQILDAIKNWDASEKHQKI